jgi:hypothetical protein
MARIATAPKRPLPGFGAPRPFLVSVRILGFMALAGLWSAIVLDDVVKKSGSRISILVRIADEARQLHARLGRLR